MSDSEAEDGHPLDGVIQKAAAASEAEVAAHEEEQEEAAAPKTSKKKAKKRKAVEPVTPGDQLIINATTDERPKTAPAKLLSTPGNILFVTDAEIRTEVGMLRLVRAPRYFDDDADLGSGQVMLTTRCFNCGQVGWEGAQHAWYGQGDRGQQWTPGATGSSSATPDF